METNKLLQKLNPADSFTLAMDEEIRSDGLAGSFGCFALQLEDQPDMNKLSQRIEEFAERFPVARASLKQVGKFYYWVDRKDPPPLFHYHKYPQEYDPADFQKDTLIAVMNKCETRETLAPIEFHWVSGKTGGVFFIRWIHPFCDARGADLIFKFLCTANREQRDMLGMPETGSLVNTRLKQYKWWQKALLFFKAKRHIDRLDQMISIQPFELPQDNLQLDYQVQRLSPEQTIKVNEMARQTVGLGCISLYYIGCLMRALEQLNSEAKGEAYCVPYAFNLRKQRAVTPMLGNHICALFAQASRKQVQNRRGLFEHLKKQHTEVIRKQLDYAFLPLMWAGGFLSLDKYGKVMRLAHGKDHERSSFWFSDIAQVDLNNDCFFDAKISGVFHVCHVSSPPSFALLSCIHRQQLTLSYCFVKPVATSKKIDRLQHLMLTELLAES